MSKNLSSVAFVMALGLAPTAAFAQSIEFGPGGVRVDPGYHGHRREVIEERHRYKDVDRDPVIVEHRRGHDHLIVEDDYGDHVHRRVIERPRHHHHSDED